MRSELVVTDVTRRTVEVPFRETPAPHMLRMLPDWRFFEVCRVDLAGGARGYGETMLFYPWSAVTDDAVDRVLGAPATAHMWDDDVGAGLQMALFDAVGRHLGVPAHELLGERVRESVPVSWWCVDMPPEDWAAEATTAADRGYDAMKVKARPWWDLREAVSAVDDAVDGGFHLGLDFNKTAVDATRAVPLLRDLAPTPVVNTFEEPIDRHDTTGYRRIREATDVPIAHHFNYDDPLSSLAAGVADRFIATDGASAMRATAGTLDTLDLPMWYQLVGTGITAVWGVHLGATLDVELLPSINCHEVFAESLLASSLPVEDGAVRVPDAPGLGYDVDETTLDALAVDMDAVTPDPERLLAVEYDGGRTDYFATGRQLRACAQDGNLPSFERGVTTRVVADDGSEWWRTTRNRVEAGPLLDP